jgi:hypothetical protein
MGKVAALVQGCTDTGERIAYGEAIERVTGIPRGVEERRRATCRALGQDTRTTSGLGRDLLSRWAQCALEDAELDLP